jgi:hypothetical protein
VTEGKCFSLHLLQLLLPMSSSTFVSVDRNRRSKYTPNPRSIGLILGLPAPNPSSALVLESIYEIVVTCNCR